MGRQEERGKLKQLEGRGRGPAEVVAGARARQPQRLRQGAEGEVKGRLGNARRCLDELIYGIAEANGEARQADLSREIPAQQKESSRGPREGNEGRVRWQP